MRKKKSRKSFIERRRSERLNIPVRIQYRPSPKKRILHETFCQNISGSGMRLRLDQRFRIGARLKTFLYFPPDRRPVSAYAKVVWCKQRDRHGKPPQFDIGLEHIRVEPRDRMRFVFLFCETMFNYFVFGKQKKL